MLLIEPMKSLDRTGHGPLILLAIVAFILLGFCLYTAPLRLIARDEGFYLYAARLVAEGNHIYTDFFHPQAPLFAYLYGAWFAAVDISWYSARMLAGIITFAIGIILMIVTRRRYGAGAAVLAVALFASCHFVFAWYLTAQTYSLSVLFLLLSCSFLGREEEKNRLPAPVVILTAGVLFGLSVSTRLFFAGLGPVWCLWILASREKFSSRIKGCFLLAAGCLLGMLPFLPFLINDFDSLYFNNLGYHFSRSTLSPEETVSNRIRVLQVVLGFVESIKFDAPQLALLIYLSVICCIKHLIFKKNPPLAFYTAAGLFGLNFLPSPTYVQYFCTLVPFLILCSIDLMVTVWKNFSGLKVPLRSVAITIVFLPLLVLYTYHLDKDYVRYTRTGEGVIGIRNQKEADHWNLPYVTSVARKLDLIESKPGTVITTWPGYLIGSHHRPLKGLENHFALLIGNLLTEEERARYHITNRPEMVAAIRNGNGKFVLVSPASRRGQMKKALASEIYAEPVDLKSLLLYVSRESETAIQE